MSEAQQLFPRAAGAAERHWHPATTGQPPRRRQARTAGPQSASLPGPGARRLGLQAEFIPRALACRGLRLKPSPSQTSPRPAPGSGEEADGKERTASQTSQAPRQ